MQKVFGTIIGEICDGVVTPADGLVAAQRSLATRPASRAGNATATLTATATYAGFTATRSFSVTVPEDIADRQKVDNALKDIVIVNQKAIRSDLALPADAPGGVVLTWDSSDPDVVTDTGEVIRPSFGSRSRPARLVVRAVLGTVSRYCYFTLTVLPLTKAEVRRSRGTH